MGTADAWQDQTHLAVSIAAGYSKWYNSTGADVAKVRAGDKEKYNHFCDLEDGDFVSPSLPIEQAVLANDPDDRKGHLYGAIIYSLREYRTRRAQSKYSDYDLAYLAHYVGDLSQPLHNYKYDDFNVKNHGAFDGVVEQDFKRIVPNIKRYMVPIRFHKANLEQEVAMEVARIANLSHNLAKKLRDRNRMITKEEAYRQLGLSASLLRAILQAL